jgi:hypothetical protein
VQVSIYNVGYISRTLVGKVRVAMVEVAAAGPDGFRRSLPLMNEDFEIFREPRGEVELNITWSYDPDPRAKTGGQSWAAFTSKKKKGQAKLEEEVQQMMQQAEVEEVMVRKQRRTKEQEEKYTAARYII